MTMGLACYVTLSGAITITIVIVSLHLDNTGFVFLASETNSENSADLPTPKKDWDADGVDEFLQVDNKTGGLAVGMAVTSPRGYGFDSPSFGITCSCN